MSSRKQLLKSESPSPATVSRNMKDLGPVPFSETLVRELQEPTITTKTFNSAVGEAASFYFHHMPNMAGYHGAYDKAMADIVNRFPSLEADGVEKWVCNYNYIRCIIWWISLRSKM